MTVIPSGNSNRVLSAKLLKPANSSAISIGVWSSAVWNGARCRGLGGAKQSELEHRYGSSGGVGISSAPSSDGRTDGRKSSPTGDPAGLVPIDLPRW